MHLVLLDSSGHARGKLKRWGFAADPRNRAVNESINQSINQTHHQIAMVISMSVLNDSPFSATHFLCFPLYSSRSKSQLQNLVQRLRDDDQATGCPQKAFRLPRTYNLRISKFRFENVRDVKAASDLLHSLEIDRMLRNSASAAVATVGNRNNTSPKAMVESDQACSNLRGRVPPLYVSLRGLSARPHPQSTKERPFTTFSVPIDTSNRLDIFSMQLREQYKSAGFKEPRFLEYDDRNGVSSAGIISGLKAVKHHKVVDKQGRKSEKKIHSKYNAQSLIAKYKDVVLADNIPLEKLSLWEEGRKSTFRGSRNEILLDEYYEEVDSIPLPQ